MRGAPKNGAEKLDHSLEWDSSCDFMDAVMESVYAFQLPRKK